MKNSHPKIGIRPIIDGRRGGIRESLEEMTMGMAQSVAKLYAAKLRYADGAPVECVIADTTIGGVAEAAAATDKFRDNNVGAVLSVTPCWCYGSETIDMDPLMPKAIWGFNKTQRPGAVYLASALAGHNQKGPVSYTHLDVYKRQASRSPSPHGSRPRSSSRSTAESTASRPTTTSKCASATGPAVTWRSATC